MKKLILLALLASPFFGCQKAENEPVFVNRDFFAELPDDQKPLIGHWADSGEGVENSSVRTLRKVDPQKGSDIESVAFHATGGLSFYPNIWRQDSPPATVGCGFGDPKTQQITFYGKWTIEQNAAGERILNQELADPMSKKWKIIELTDDVLRFEKR